MIEPNGPLPSSVYWRRRAWAAGVSVLAVVLLAWLIGGLVSADDQHPVQGTADAAVLGASSSTTARRPSVPPSSQSPTNPSGSVTTSPGAGSPTSGEAVPATSPVPPTTTAAPPPPGPPAPCPDPVIKVVAGPDAPAYPVGARPLLRLRITNVGPAPCLRDVSRALREILVLAPDGTRLWSSNDCYGPRQQDVRTLAPNQPVEFTVNWAGRTSAPGCPAGRKAVPPGTYQVVGKLGGLAGPPAPLTLT